MSILNKCAFNTYLHNTKINFDYKFVFLCVKRLRKPLTIDTVTMTVVTTQ